MKAALAYFSTSQGLRCLLECPDGVYDYGSPSWRIEPAEFCALVEQVFAEPSELLYHWLQEATGIYESIQGRTFAWRWSRYKLTFENQHIGIE